MKTKTIVFAFLAVTAGVIAYTRPHNAIPSDLRDAVADNGQLSFNIHAVGKDGGNIPESKTAASAGQSRGWKHISFQAADNASINIDYAIAGYDTGQHSMDEAVIYAGPVWITVSNPAYNGTEKVRATIIDATDWQPVDIDLEYIEAVGGKHFIGRSGQRVALLARHLDIKYPKKVKELVIAVNGNRLKDPVSGTHNFKFRMPFD